MLNDTESICVAAVIQDSIDRLHAIGRLLPVPMPSSETRPNIPDVSAAAEIVVPINVKTKESRHELFPKNLKNEIQTKATFDDDVFKLQKDRSFLEQTLQKTLTEIKCYNTYKILQDTVRVESVKKSQYEVVIRREQVLNQRIAKLVKHLAKSKGEKEHLLLKCNDTVTRLADQLRESKVRTHLEQKYVQNQCSASVFQIKKKLRTAEKNITMGMDKVKSTIDNEQRINKSFDDFVKKNLEKLEQKMEYWMEKHETETEAKDREIELLTVAKQAAIDRIAQISVLMETYTNELEADRQERERRRSEKEAQARLSGAVIRIQAWWRGLLVRLFLGPFKKLAKFIKDRKAELAKKKK